MIIPAPPRFNQRPAIFFHSPLYVHPHLFVQRLFCSYLRYLTIKKEHPAVATVRLSVAYQFEQTAAFVSLRAFIRD